MQGWFMITGAVGGLGKAFCAACAQRGYGLFLTDVSPELLDILATGLRNEYNVPVQVYACNLADERGRDMLFSRIRELNIPFVGLINVAGMDTEGEFISKDLSLCPDDDAAQHDERRREYPYPPSISKSGG